MEIFTVFVIFLFESLETSLSVLIPENVYATIPQSVSFVRCVQTQNSCSFSPTKSWVINFNAKLRVVIINFALNGKANRLVNVLAKTLNGC